MQKGFAHILIIGLLVVILIIVVAMGILSGLFTKLVVEVTTPNCQDPVLTTAPTINNENLQHLVPLGNISPPGHYLPTPHIYYTLKRGSDNLTLKTRIYSPADVRVERITYIEDTRQGKLVAADYKVSMVPCKEVQIYFDHMQELAPKLAPAWKSGKPSCSENTFGSTAVGRYCKMDVNLTLKSGEEIGNAGGAMPTGWDFGATDTRKTPLQFTNNKRYQTDQLQTICPIDLFPKEIKDNLYQFFGNEYRERTEQPICGTIMQDVPGTAQGNWFDGKGKSYELENAQKSLSLIHDNTDPKLAVMVGGGVLGSDIYIKFLPKHSGTINREFSEIKPETQVYCYQAESLGAAPIPEQQNMSVLIKLVSEAELQVERLSVPCDTTLMLKNPYTFIR